MGDKARAQSTVWNKMEWPKRKWLTNEASAVRLKERILDHVQKALALNQVQTSSYSMGKPYLLKDKLFFTSDDIDEVRQSSDIFRKYLENKKESHGSKPSIH